MVESPVLSLVRRCLLGLVALGTLGMSAELGLVGHYGDTNQLIPLVMAGMGMIASVAVATWPSPATVRSLQFIMLCYAGAGVIGISMHYQANLATVREADPALAGRALFWRVVQSTAPPALAPGILIQLSLLGFLSTYRHPALGDEHSTLGS